MDILKEIKELKEVFIKFCDDIVEEDFIYKNPSSRNVLIWTLTDYHFTLLSKENFILFWKKLWRLKAIIKNKESFLDDDSKKNINKFLFQIERNTKIKTKSKSCDFKTKSEFKNKLSEYIDEIYNTIENISDLISDNIKKENYFINNWTVNNHWNFAVENNWTQKIEINNQIDEIIKILDEKNIEQKEEIKKLLEEFKNSWDKNKLLEAFNIIWTWASILWINVLAWIKMMFGN